MKIRVYYEDTDVGGVVYYANYLKFCERARSEIFFQKGLKPVAGDCHFVVKELQAKYLKPAFFADILEVKTSLKKLGSTFVELCQEIYKDEEKIFAMDIKLVFLCDSRPSRIPVEFKNLFLPLLQEK
ncbi:YbgC/FadM family acyl-CoA thioesterase [Nitrosophilus alvini]|uniref:YbgC/FadM family acyl-CoA thioesterase n=1 Tax=Nitrosophilus alvini TaxID=2714855 RepID=UPI00190AA442|nr:YbgC/FadM family acyl-CoA thioesterase [Nitrosophilus alvini]